MAISATIQKRIDEARAADAKKTGAAALSLVPAASGGGDDKEKSAVKQIIDIANKHFDLIHTSDNTGYAVEDCVAQPIGSRAFRLHLTKLFYEKTRRTVSETTMRTVLDALESFALFDAKSERAVNLRVAEHVVPFDF